jgi:hypothetical protein
MSRSSENVGASTSRNSKGLYDLYRDSLTYSLEDNKYTFTEHNALSSSDTEIQFQSPVLCTRAWIIQ